MVPLASILVSCDPRCCTLLHSAALCYGFAVGRILCADQNLR